MKTYTMMGAVKKIFKLATAANDFLVASGAGVFVKKTLAEVKVILGLGSWTAYTPTVTPSTGTPDGGWNVTAIGRWTQIGKTVFFNVEVTVTNKGNGGGSLNVTLPVTSLGYWYGSSGAEIMVTGKTVQGGISGTVVGCRFYDYGSLCVNGYLFYVSGNYEVA